MARKPAAQASLFGDGAAVDGVALVAIDRPAATLGKSHRQFNRLTGQIRQERERLAAWEAYLPRLHERVVSEMQPVEKAIRAAQRRLLDTLDGLLTKPEHGAKLSRARRAKLQATVESLIEELLAAADPDAPDPDLLAMQARHCEVSGDERQQFEVEFAEAMIGSIFGEDMLAGHSARNLDDLLQHVDQKAGEQAEAEARERDARAEARRAKPGRPTKAEQAAERREQAAKEAGASVREIYRKLASGLHPDREPDPAERERKTLLMQRANQAYERDDLLELLGLQIEIEQIDADHLADAPETRIRHYNQVLREQLTALQQKLHEVAVPLQLDFGLSARNEGPKALDAAFTARLAQGRALCKQIDADLLQLADPKRRRAWIDALPEPGPGPDEFGLLEALLGAAVASPPRPRRRRRR
jgi:hypothetical protein